MSRLRTHYAAGGTFVESTASYQRRFVAGCIWCKAGRPPPRIIELQWPLPTTDQPNDVNCGNCLRMMSKWWKRVGD